MSVGIQSLEMKLPVALPEQNPAIAMEPTIDAEPYGSRSMFDRLRETRAGRVVATGVAALAISAGVEKLGVETAVASEPVKVEYKNETTTSQLSVGGNTMSDEDIESDKVNIMGNIKVNGMPKAHRRKAERNGDCKTVNGKKTITYTLGHNENGRAPGRDTRESRFCKVKGEWIRVLCGNKAWFKRKPARAVENVVWVKDFKKAPLKVSVHSEADALAICSTANTFALGYGHGEADASASANLSSTLNAKGRVRSFTAKYSASAKAEAKSEAKTAALAVCAEQQQTPPEKPPMPPEQEQPTKPPMVCDPNIDVCSPAAMQRTSATGSKFNSQLLYDKEA